MASRLVLMPVLPSVTVSAAENFPGSDWFAIASRIDLPERLLENAAFEKKTAPVTVAERRKNSRRCMGTSWKRTQSDSLKFNIIPRGRRHPEGPRFHQRPEGSPSRRSSQADRQFANQTACEIPPSALESPKSPAATPKPRSPVSSSDQTISRHHPFHSTQPASHRHPPPLRPPANAYTAIPSSPAAVAEPPPAAAAAAPAAPVSR